MLDKADDILAQVTSHQIGYFVCPRCEKPHSNLRFDPIVNPSDGLFRHWSVCEETASPILLYWNGEVARVK